MPTDADLGDLFRRFRDNATLVGVIYDDPPEWMKLVWSRLLLALAGEAIEYFDGCWDENSDIAMQLFGYTKSRIIRMTAKGANPSKDATIHTWSYSRRLLRRVEFDGGAPLLDKIHPTWPGHFSVTATYPDERIVLPQPLNSTVEQRQALQRFLPSLLADLSIE